MTKDPLTNVETRPVHCQMNSAFEQSRTAYVSALLITLYVLQFISRLAYAYFIHTDASKHVSIEFHPPAISATINNFSPDLGPLILMTGPSEYIKRRICTCA
jgi:hypothetical protein